jgi:putative ABC transport system permease protein
MGIVLGVAVFVAMHAADEYVLSAFSETIDRIAGKTELQITAGEAGFSEDILEKVQASPLVRVAAPVVEAVVESGLPGQGTLLVLAVDMTGDRSLREYDFDSGEDAIVEDPLVFLAQPDSIIVSKELADRHHLTVGARLPLQTAEGEKFFTIRGIMKSAGLASAFGGNLAVMDVYAAQLAFGRGRTFDRIDLAVKRGMDVAEVQRKLSALLGPGFEIQPPASRGRQAETMLQGYGVMVSISSLFALFIGVFIIYQSFAIAVTQRRFEIGLLRALGATRRQVQRLFFIESGVLGLAGAAAGILLGVLIARATASAMSGLASDLYGVARQTGAVPTRPGILAVAAVVGIATSVLAAMLPARTASCIDPVQALQKADLTPGASGWRRNRVLLASLVAMMAVVLLTLGARRPIFYTAYGFTLVAVVMAAPVLSTAFARAMRPVLTWMKPVEGALAADSLIQSPRRTSSTVLALMLSVALIVAFGGMARASYGSVVEWLNTFLNADLYVMPSPRLDLRTQRFPPALAAEIAATPGVGRVQMFRDARVNFRGLRVMAVAIEMPSVAATARTRPVQGDAAAMYQMAAAGQGLIVSDNLAQRLRLRLGQTLELQAPYGILQLPIVGVIVDYTDQQGSIFMDRSVWLRYWRDDSVSDFRVFIAPGAESAQVRRRLVERFAGKRHIFVLTSDESRHYVLGIANQWFGLMNVQVGVAVLVAILGIVNSLTVSIADRRRELGVLQAVGALRGQIRRTIWLEALAVAALGLILGCIFGAVNLYYVLDIVQRDVAGLRLDYQYPVTTLFVLSPAVLLAAFAAALWPAESAVRTPLVEALDYE